jgi:hypothetical protein
MVGCSRWATRPSATKAPPCQSHGRGFFMPRSVRRPDIRDHPTRMIALLRSRQPPPRFPRGFISFRTPGDRGMFERFDGGSATRIYILQPTYDPVIEYYTRGAGAPACRRIPSRPDQADRPDRPDSRMAPCGRPDDQLGRYDAGPRCGVAAGQPAACDAPEPSGQFAAGARRTLGRWARWIPSSSGNRQPLSARSPGSETKR